MGKKNNKLKEEVNITQVDAFIMTDLESALMMYIKDKLPRIIKWGIWLMLILIDLPLAIYNSVRVIMDSSFTFGGFSAEVYNEVKTFLSVVLIVYLAYLGIRFLFNIINICFPSNEICIPYKLLDTVGTKSFVWYGEDLYLFDLSIDSSYVTRNLSLLNDLITRLESSTDFKQKTLYFNALKVKEKVESFKPNSKRYLVSIIQVELFCNG